MSNSDDYEAIYRRIEDLAGIDRTPRILAQINALELSDYEKRLELLIDIGYKPTNYAVWGNLRVFSQCEWTNLLLGIEPMIFDIRFPNPDDFDVLIRTVRIWLVVHRLIDDQLRDVGATNTNPEIIKRDRDGIANDSYNQSDLILATSAVSLPIPYQLSHRTDEQPIWILRKSLGGYWEVGHEANPKKLKAITAFMDMAYAISAEGTDISPLKLPGNQSEEGGNIAANSPSSARADLSLDTVDGIPLEEQAWTGFGSDDVADGKARKHYENARRKLVEEIEIAQETGNSAEEVQAQARLDELKRYMNETTMPGGKSKKLSTGDPIEKATAAARDRKATAIKNIKNAGLHEMAKHLNDYYHVGKRAVAYSKGPPFPKWLLQ